jgi:hypothetical protein
MNDCLEYTKYKHRKDVMNGLAGLIDAGIIARSEYEFEYFLNPMVVFNGDRVTFAKTYIKKKKEDQDGDTRTDSFTSVIDELESTFHNGGQKKI